MGKSKDEYIELCQVEMSRAFYEEHQELLKPPECKLKAAYAVNPSLADNQKRQELLEKMRLAQEELREWEYECHYKKQINGTDR